MSTHWIHTPLSSVIDRNWICAGGGHAVERRFAPLLWAFASCSTVSTHSTTRITSSVCVCVRVRVCVCVREREREREREGERERVSKRKRARARGWGRDCAPKRESNHSACCFPPRFSAPCACACVCVCVCVCVCERERERERDRDRTRRRECQITLFIAWWDLTPSKSTFFL